MPSVARVRSTASTIFFLPNFERCERPTAASKRESGVHPGRLAQGPDEKSGRAGREFGFIYLSLTEELHSVGGVWPAARIGTSRAAVNASGVAVPRTARGPVSSRWAKSALHGPAPAPATSRDGLSSKRARSEERRVGNTERAGTSKHD